jgi:hypothetical protein
VSRRTASRIHMAVCVLRRPTDKYSAIPSTIQSGRFWSRIFRLSLLSARSY